MIGRLEGRLVDLVPGRAIVDAGGVGYAVHTTLRAFEKLAGADRAALWIHTQVRDDAIVLFGFVERPELEAFELLISVAGVGPRTALAVLSGLTPGELAETVASGDLARLQRTPGIGRKTAERLQLELRDRLPAASAAVLDRRLDAVSALVNLGYSERDARRAVDGVLGQAEAGEPGELADLLKVALRRLTR